MSEQEEHPQSIHWDEHGEPHSTQFGDRYFAKGEGLDESRAVFLDSNKLQQRFQALADNDHFIVGETGFGTGLNFLACWQLWHQWAPSSARLTFISVEKYPLMSTELEQALKLWPELQTLSTELMEAYRHNFLGNACSHFQNFRFGKVRLLLIIDEATEGFKQILSAEHSGFCQPDWRVDAWFLDGFAPSKNPDMWRPALFQTLSALSRKGTSFATFTAASVVRKGLKAAGFKVEKIPGFGRKREMIRGEYAASRPSLEFENEKTPWSVIANFKAAEATQQVAIIGAGIAGHYLAHALSKRGLKVTLIERSKEVASEASGNPQGMLYAKLH